MNVLYRLLRQDPASREGIVTVTSGLGIAVNLLIAAVKVVLGLLTASIAIVSEGVNNAADALTSILTLVGTKLSRKHPDEKHPFGYGRVEYLTGLVISALILFTGAEVLISSVKLIFHPEELSVSLLSILIVAVSAVVKFALGIYTIRMGRKAGSAALEAVGAESRNDSFASAITILSAAVFLLFHVSVDAYAGVLTSLLILKAGFDALKETVSDLIGRPGERELAEKLYQEIREADGVLSAADMMLHNYGPEAWSGSVNLEIDHEKSVGEVYRTLHALQLRILQEHRVTMVFGIYAVDNDHEETRQVRKTVGSYVQAHDHIRGFHAVYLDPDSDRLYCDLVVDYALQDWDGLREDFTACMQRAFPDRELMLTIETEYV